MPENPQVYPYRRNEETATADGPQLMAKAVRSVATKRSWRIEPLTVALVIAGFFLGRAEILGGLYPFGPAFVAAVTLQYRRTSFLFVLPVLVGELMVLQGKAWPYLAISLLIWGIFLFYHHIDGKKQWLVVPAVILAVVASIQAVTAVFTEPSSYALMVSVFNGLFAAGLSIVAMLVLQVLRKPLASRRLGSDELVCCFILLLGCVSGLGNFHIGNVNLQDVASRFVVMLAALWGGAGAGAGVGALFGIIPSLSGLASPVAVGVYAFSGLLAGAFNGFGKMGTAAGFLLGNVLLSLYILNSSAIQASLLTSLIAAVVLLLFPGVWLRKWGKSFSQTTFKSAGEERGERLLRIASRRMRSVALLFQDLSRSCQDLAAAQPVSTTENIEMVLSCLSRQVCQDCTMKHICWNVDLEQTYSGVMHLFRLAEDNGAAYIKDAPTNFQKRCPRLKELIATVNCLYELYCRSNYWQAQRASTQLLISSQLSGTAQVLEQLSREMGTCARERAMLEMELAKDLSSRSLPVESANMMYMTEKSLDIWVNFSSCPGEIRCREGVASSISALLGRDYQVAECNCSDTCGERCRFRLLEEGARRLNVGKAQLAKDGKGICGDSGSTVLLNEGKQLLMISDGMGIGMKAAKESGSAIRILSKLLEAGFNQETAIDTVNTVLMLRGKEESFVTLDICVVDLYSGLAEFVKTGGAPSFIKRGRRVKVVKSDSLPVGMLQKVEKETVLEDLQEGDLVIMASDGLMDAENQTDIQWLLSLLSQAEIYEAQPLAEYLLGKAVAVSGGRLKDDITILVAKVEAA